MKPNHLHSFGLAIACCLVWTVSPAAFAASVGLGWKPSPSIGAAGYNIYYGVSGSFTNRHDAGNVTSTTIGDLQPGNTYFFFATTYDARRNESGPSETIFFYVNSPPSALNLSGETLRDQPLAINLAGRDREARPLTFAIVNPPAHGTLSGIAPTLVYTPSRWYIGPDTFTYKVNDGKTDSKPATVKLTVVQPPDTAPPMVRITSPSKGAAVVDTTIIDAQAIDDRGVARIELYLDNRLLSSSAGRFARVSLDTTGFADGPHTVSVRAYDAAGNRGESSVEVNVQNTTPFTDTTPPVVTIASPPDWTTITTDFTVDIRTSDNVGVTRVDLYLDGQLCGTSTTRNPSFTVMASELASGTHTFQANAVDAANNQGCSNVVTVRK